MGITAEQALGVAKKYTDKAIEGAGGLQGKSAYEIAVDNGFIGTEAQWLESLQGQDGNDGKSAYQVAVDEGYTGTEAQWLESLKGAKGDKGDTGETGATGPQGEQGIQGIQGETGTKGDKGDKGDTGPGIAQGGTAGQILRKKSSTDYDTEWGNNGIEDTEFTSIKTILGTI